MADACTCGHEASLHTEYLGRPIWCRDIYCGCITYDPAPAGGEPASLVRGARSEEPAGAPDNPTTAKDVA